MLISGIPPSSDTEMLLNVFATELQEQIHSQELEPDIIFDAVKSLHKRIRIICFNCINLDMVY